MNTVFKVVVAKASGYRSAVMSEKWRTWYAKELDLTYTLNQRTKAPRGSMGVLVFDTLANAREFRDKISNDARVLECLFAGEAVPLQFYPALRSLTKFSKSHNRLHRHFRRGEILSWINNQSPHRFISISWNIAPIGSFSVESVVPFRVVK